MHRYTDQTERMAQAIVELALDRMRMEPPLDGPRPPEDLAVRVGETVTAKGLGEDAALRVWTDVLSPATMSPQTAASSPRPRS